MRITEITITDRNYLRFFRKEARLEGGIKPRSEAYSYREILEWDVTDNYLFTDFQHNIYNWAYFHPKWRNLRGSDPRLLETDKLFQYVNREECARFLDYNPRFYNTLRKVFGEGVEYFGVVGRPILEAVTDPETGGGFHLVIYFPVEKRGPDEIRKLIDFRRRIRNGLPLKERLLITCFLK